MEKKMKDNTEKLLTKLNDKMQAIENLLILQLIQNGVTSEQISIALKVKSINPSNISDSLSVIKLKKKEVKNG